MTEARTITLTLSEAEAAALGWALIGEADTIRRMIAQLRSDRADGNEPLEVLERKAVMLSVIRRRLRDATAGMRGTTPKPATETATGVSPEFAVPLEQVQFRASPDQSALDVSATIPAEYGPVVLARLNAAPSGVSFGYAKKQDTAAPGPTTAKPPYPEHDREIVILECLVREPGKWPEEFRATVEVTWEVFDDAMFDRGLHREIVMNQLKRLRSQALTERGHKSPIMENERWGHFSANAPLAKRVPRLLDW